MQAFWTIYKRQLFAWFCAPIAYITATAFWLVAGLSFCRLISQSMQERLLLGDVLFGSVFFWSMALAAITLITMGVFADEQKSGAIEMLLTAPVTDTQVILAKYCAALTCYILLCAPTFAFGPVLNLVAPAPVFSDPAPLLGGYAIMLLIGACYVAFGVMASALTRSQVAAACICFTGLGLTFFSDVFEQILPDGRGSAIFAHLSAARHIMDFSQGILDSRPLALYLSGIIFFLFATVKLLGARHWK